MLLLHVACMADCIRKCEVRTEEENGKERELGRVLEDLDSGPILPPTGFFLDLDFHTWKRRRLGMIRGSQATYLEVLAFHDFE